MPLRAVFLDAGGTLLHEEPSRFAIYAEAAVARGLDVDARTMRGLMRRAHEELPRELDGAFRYSDPWFAAFVRHVFHGSLGLPEAEVEGLLGELFRRFEDARSFRLYPGALELLDGLRERGLVVGVVSNWSARLPRVLAALDLERRLDFALSSALVRAEKPEPGIFRMALERAEAMPTEAVHAGDRPREDVGGARAAGLDAVLVDHHGRLPADRAGEDGWRGSVRVENLGALASYILERST